GPEHRPEDCYRPRRPDRAGQHAGTGDDLYGHAVGRSGIAKEPQVNPGPVIPLAKGERTMRWSNVVLGLVLAGVLAAPLQAGEGKARTFRFAKGEVGKVPDGWQATQTNKGANSSIWKVVADDTAPSKSGFALAQTAESPSAVFNLCVAKD